MAFPVKIVSGDLPDSCLDIGIGNLGIRIHELGDFDADDLACLLLDTLPVVGDESLAFDSRSIDQLVGLGIDGEEDTDHALVDKGRTVLDDGVGDRDRGFAVDIDGIRRIVSAPGDLVVHKDQDVSVVADEGMVLRKSALDGKIRMQLKHSVFAVDRHEEVRTGDLLEKTHFLLGSVSGSMEVVQNGVRDNGCPKTGKGVDNAVDGSRVSRNDGGGEDDGIARHHMHEAVIAPGNPGKNCHRLALVSGAEDSDLVCREVPKIFRSGKIGIRNTDIAHIPGCLDICRHGTSEDDDLSSELHGCLDDLDDTGDIGREGRDDKTSGCFREDIPDSLQDASFGLRIAVSFGIRGIRHEKVDSSVAEVAELRDIEIMVDRSKVDLEIARLDDRSLGSRDENAVAIRNGVGDMIELAGELSELQNRILVIFEELRLGMDFVVFQLVLDKSTGDLRGIDDRDLHCLEKERNRTDMVFMAVRDDKTLDLVLVLLQMGEFRDYIIDTRHIIIREKDTAVDDQDRCGILDAVHILSDFSKSA